jgi:hypothetical protein
LWLLPLASHASTLADQFLVAQPSLKDNPDKLLYVDDVYLLSRPVGVSPVEYLRELAGKDFDLLYDIAMCESHFNESAKNAHSTASGIFQFLDSTWKSWGTGDVFNAYDNIEAGVKLFNAKGSSPWLASSDCWSH